MISVQQDSCAWTTECSGVPDLESRRVARAVFQVRYESKAPLALSSHVRFYPNSETHKGPLRDILAKNMRRLRAARGISPEALAHECGINRTYLSAVERSERTVSIGNIARIAKGLQVVRYRRNGVMHEARASREVILSCGTVNSPKLLELSGIGNPQILSKYGISIVHELPGVGENLRDHYGPTMKWTLTKPGISLSDRGRGWKLLRELVQYVLFGTGFISQGIGTMRVFTRSHAGVEEADIQMIANPYIVDLKNGKRSMSPVNGFLIYTQVQRPESAGNIHIHSTDPFVPPAINYNFLATENDRRVAIMSVRRAREIVEAPPLGTIIGEEVLPGPKIQSDDEIVDFIRKTGTTTFHFACTCKMGHDAMAVVDDRLRVHGITGLRIADASIMPTMPSGNTSIPCVMIGEKCADMVLSDATN